MQANKIGILTATEQELAPLLKKFSGLIFQSAFNLSLWKYHNPKNCEIILAYSGIGKTNASYAAGILCALHNVDFIVHFGICGVYPQEKASIGDVIIIEKCFLGDEGVFYSCDNFGSYRDINIPVLREKNNKTIYESMDTDEDVIQFAKRIGVLDFHGKFSIRIGSTLSVSMTSGTKKIAEFRKKTFGATIEDMETSAVMIACKRSGVPVLPLRGISNIAGDRNRANWKIDLALDNTIQVVLKVLDATIKYGEQNGQR